MRTLVALATYNEIENLPSLVDAVLDALPGCDVLVVDDNSPDGTGRWADEKAAAEPRVRVLHRAGKLGLGSATVEAMRVALGEPSEPGYDAFCTLDADWSHPPALLPTLVGLLGSADVAVGSRYAPGGGIEGWPLRRHVASRLVNFAARWLLWLPTSDSSGSLRAYRVDALRKLDLGAMECPGYAYLEEVLWRLKRTGATFAEAPFTFTDRRAGESKINRREVTAAARLILRLGLRTWTGR
ncbi:MAG: polyprenol monophosphomannose synthase [Lacipirellulaceae bacterium]